MPRGIPVDDATRVRVMALHAEGLSRNEIARRSGVSTFAVSGIVKAAGEGFDRSKTAVAVAAVRVDRASRRAAIIDRLYGRTEHVLDRLEAETYTWTVAVPGSGLERQYDSDPPAKDERDLAGAMTAYLLQASRLEVVDADPNEGLPAVDAWLTHMTEG